MSIKNPMNKIEKLINELCPEGVEFRELGEVGVLIGGSGLPKTDFTDSGVGCIHYGQIYTYYGIYSNQTISFVSEASATKLKKVKQGDIIIAKTSENVEDICKSVAYLGVDDIVTGGHTAIFKHKQNSKYLSYYINGAKEFQIQKRKVTIGVKVIDVSLKNLAKIKIPIPPLTIQKEIVKILDNFTQLEAELEARKKQYEHYREALLSFDDGVEFRELGEACLSISAGGDLPKKYKKGQTIPSDENPYPIYANATAMKGLYGYTEYSLEGYCRNKRHTDP
jgi:type I restriction enzyme S subunit